MSPCLSARSVRRDRQGDRSGRVLLAAALLGAVAACAPALAPSGPPAAPPPAVPAPDRPTVAERPRAIVAATMPTARYQVRVITALEADSLGPGDSVPQRLYDTITTTATIAVGGERSPDAAPAAPGILRASGTVSAFRVTTSDRVRSARASALPGVTAAAPIPDTGLSVAFAAVFDSVLARLTPTPPIANECDQPAVAAAELARDVLMRLPDTLSPGATWTDRARVFACRGGVPITMQLVNTTRVVDLAPDGSRATLERTVVTTAEGQLALGWRTVALRGAGETRSTITLRLPDGVIEQVTGAGLTRFEASDSARPTARRTTIVQRSTIEVRRLPP